MPSRKQLLSVARQLRKRPTRAERLLWSKLRRRQLAGRKFRRQHVLPPYIVDFYCHSAELVVEIDGPDHDTPQAQQRDKNRDAFLKKHRRVCSIIRLPQERVLTDLTGVLDDLRQVLMEE